MDKSATQARYRIMLSQAEHFAEKDNYVDAVARAQLLVSDVESAIAAATDSDKEWLQRDAAFFRRCLRNIEKRAAEWQASCEARKATFTEREIRNYNNRELLSGTK